MRNLKRALSLALASVMLLGMMVVGTSAASFPDVDDNDNIEAIEVLNAVGVMIGDRGNFKPDDPVTRNEMAVIMAKLLLGTYEADSYVGTHPFTDVPQWADKYVAACYASGIVAGTSSTTYSGGQNLTAVQAAAMMLRALGYEDLSKNAVRWDQPVAAKANELNLFKGLTGAGNATMDRNSVAKLALNTLQATMVTTRRDLSAENGNLTTVTSYNERTNDPYDYDGETDNRLQLCEYLYKGDLKLATDEDDMGRPANVWTYKSDEVIKFAQDADRVVVVDKEQSLADEIKDVNKNWTTITSSTLNGGTLSGNVLVGDVVEIYMDSDTPNTVARAAITRYSMDEVTGAVTTKGSGDDLEIRIPGVFGYTDADKVDGDYDALAKDDIIYYYQDNAGVYHFAKADSFEGTYTGTRSGTPLKMIINGSNYIENGNVNPINNTTDKNASYDFYTDPNGYLIASKKNEETSKDYVVIQEISYAQGTGGITGAKAVEARLVKMDGTVEVVKVKSVQNGSGAGNLYVGIDENSTETNGDNKFLAYNLGSDVDVNATVSALAGTAFFTYSVNSDKEYELTKVVAVPADKLTTAALTNDTSNDSGTGTPEIKNGSATMYNNIAVNKNTVFIVATEKGGKSFKVYNGISEVPDIALSATSGEAVGAYVAENNIATYVYVGGYKDANISGDYVFFLKATEAAKIAEKDGDDTIYYNTYKAIVGGKYDEAVKVKASSSNTVALDTGSDSIAVGLFTPTYDSDGLITKILDKDNDEAVAIGYKMEGGILLAGSKPYTCADDALVFIMDEDGNVTEAEAADIDEDENDSVYVVKTKASEDVVDFVVIIENEDKGKVVVKEENQSGTASTTTVTISDDANDTEQEIVITGAVVPGVATGDQATMGAITPVAGKGFTIVKFTLPSYLKGSSVAVRQTNDALSEYYSTDPNVDGNVKFRAAQNLSGETEFMLMVMVGKTATLEFDIAGCTDQSDFKADYTFTFDGTNLTVAS